MPTMHDDDELERAREFVAEYGRVCAATATNQQPRTLESYDATERERDRAFLGALATLARLAPPDERRSALQLLTRYASDWGDTRH